MDFLSSKQDPYMKILHKLHTDARNEIKLSFNYHKHTLLSDLKELYSTMEVYCKILVIHIYFPVNMKILLVMKNF